MIYLHEIPRGSIIYCEVEDGSTFVRMNNLDGAYSHCTTENGGTTHLSAMAQLELVEQTEIFGEKLNYYKIVTEEQV